MARAASKPKKEISMEEALWKSADKLRGSVEPAEYKHVVLSLFFLKFASDKFEAQRKTISEKYGEKFVDNVAFYTKDNVFFLPEISRWSFIMANAKQDDIALKIDTALYTIEKANPTLKGALPDNYYSRLHIDTAKLASLLDEIDKVSNDYKGDTSSALLEVLDPEQNSHFRDHYVELPLDLSKVLFIATANDAGNIPRPLLDRMELIEIGSYTANEKFHIGKEHLIDKELAKNGLTKEQLSISDSALKDIIEHYTREAGVRGLERMIGSICRKAARDILQKKVKSVHVSGRNLEKYLGKPKYRADMANEADDIGIVRGLAWTSVGGDTLQIEVNVMAGKGEVELTGQLGDVMKESAMTGISYIRSIADQYKITPDYFKEHDFHIHIPEGAVPKDGPSAGITMATAVLSAITETPVKCKVAMTGEITLRGRVLPIGGLKEKLLAAKTAGITTVLVPKENERDVDEISKEIKSGMEIIYVERMEEVIEHAFAKAQKKTGASKRKKGVTDGN